MINFVHRRETWKLHKDNVKSDFRSYLHQQVQGKQSKCYENILKKALIEVIGRSCGWTKGPPQRNMLAGYLVIVIVLCNILVIVFAVSAPLSAEHGL